MSMVAPVYEAKVAALLEMTAADPEAATPKEI